MPSFVEIGPVEKEKIWKVYDDNNDNNDNYDDDDNGQIVVRKTHLSLLLR